MENYEKFILGLIFLGFVCLIFRESRKDKEYEERELKRKAEEKQSKEVEQLARLNLINSALAAIPDVDLAINTLRKQFHWREILFICLVYPLHLDLLKEISYSENEVLELPNLHLNMLNRDERDVLSDARKAARSYNQYDDWHISDYAQKPTVDTLCDLINYGYVKTKEPFSFESRSFQCSLTNNGKSIIYLDNKFCSKGFAANVFISKSLSSEETKLIRTIMGRVIAQMAQLNAATQATNCRTNVTQNATGHGFSKSGHISKDKIIAWFDSSLADSLSIAFANKLGISNEPTEAETKKLGLVIEAYKANYARLAARDFSLASEDKLKLESALKLTNGENPMTIKLVKLLASLT